MSCYAASQFPKVVKNGAVNFGYWYINPIGGDQKSLTSFGHHLLGFIWVKTPIDSDQKTFSDISTSFGLTTFGCVTL